MLRAKRKPASVGEILNKECVEPLGPTQTVLAEATAQACERTATTGAA